MGRVIDRLHSLRTYDLFRIKGKVAGSAEVYVEEPRLPCRHISLAKQFDDGLSSSACFHDTVAVADTEPQKQARIAGEICPINVVYPSGIANPANNCYANSVLQCLLNHPSFSKRNQGPV